jgi:hypothetical protein
MKKQSNLPESFKYSKESSKREIIVMSYIKKIRYQISKPMNYIKV